MFRTAPKIAARRNIKNPAILTFIIALIQSKALRGQLAPNRVLL
jgi:hypothetical protein